MSNFNVSTLKSLIPGPLAAIATYIPKPGASSQLSTVQRLWHAHNMLDKDKQFQDFDNHDTRGKQGTLFVRSSEEQESSKGFLGERAVKLRPKVVSYCGKGEGGAEKRAKKDTAGEEGKHAQDLHGKGVHGPLRK